MTIRDLKEKVQKIVEDAFEGEDLNVDLDSIDKKDLKLEEILFDSIITPVDNLQQELSD